MDNSGLYSIMAGKTYENPRPARLSTNSLHLRDCRSQQPTKATSQRSRREKNSPSYSKLGPLIPAAEVELHSRKQPSLRQAQEKPRSRQSSKIMNQAHAHHANAPKDHDDGQEDGRSEALEQYIREWFEDGIGDEEDCKRGIVIPRSHVQILLQAGDTSITDVCAVEEGDEVEEGEPGDELKV